MRLVADTVDGVTHLLQLMEMASHVHSQVVQMMATVIDRCKRPATALLERRRERVLMALDERRRWQRLPLRIPVFVQSQASSPRVPMEFAAALNISAGGALLHTKSLFPVNSIITVRVPLSPALGKEHQEQTIQARILRFETRENGFNLAVEFAQALIRSSESQAAAGIE